MKTISTTKIIALMATVMAVGLIVFGLTAFSFTAFASNANSDTSLGASFEISESTLFPKKGGPARAADYEAVPAQQALNSGYHAIELTAPRDLPN